MSGKAGDEPAFFIYIKTSPLKQGIISTKYDIFLNSNQPQDIKRILLFNSLILFYLHMLSGILCYILII